MDHAKQQSTHRRSEQHSQAGPTQADFGSNQDQRQDLPELDLGETTLVLDSAAADLDASIANADPLDPFEDEAAWSGSTAERWRGLALGLSDARAQFDGNNQPSTPFGIDTEKHAIGGMAKAIEKVESTAMGLEAMKVGFIAGGAVLKVADETMQVSLGLLERRGYVDDGPTGGALLDESLEVGTPSAAGNALEGLPLVAEQVMASQRDVNGTWAAVRATAIEGTSSADASRKAEIEAALAYVDATLGAVTSVQGFDPAKLSSKAGDGVSTLGALLAGPELARLQANISAVAGHGGSLRAAGEAEMLQNALEEMAADVEKLQNTVARAQPDSIDSLNKEDQAGTSMADARVSQEAATDIIRRVQNRTKDTKGRMKGALTASLHEPARSVLHDRGRTGRDMTHLDALIESLESRRASHARQVKLIEEA